MTQDVKPRRSYRSTRRAEQVEQTRRDIVTSAGAQFRIHGYGGVSMPALAAQAGVSVETIYRAFGSKAGLFRAVVDAAVAGGATRAQMPVTERPAIRAITAEPDPRRQIERYAATQPGIHRRAGPLLRVLAEAAPSDPALRALWESIETDRRHGQGGFVRMLAARQVVRGGLDVEAASDALWALTSLAVYDLLTGLRGWSDDQYRAWLADALAALLLDPQTDTG